MEVAIFLVAIALLVLQLQVSEKKKPLIQHLHINMAELLIRCGSKEDVMKVADMIVKTIKEEADKEINNRK